MYFTLESTNIICSQNFDSRFVQNHKKLIPSLLDCRIRLRSFVAAQSSESFVSFLLKFLSLADRFVQQKETSDHSGVHHGRNGTLANDRVTVGATKRSDHQTDAADHLRHGSNAPQRQAAQDLCWTQDTQEGLDGDSQGGDKGCRDTRRFVEGSDAESHQRVKESRDDGGC